MPSRVEFRGKSPGVVPHTVHARLKATADEKYFQNFRTCLLPRESAVTPGSNRHSLQPAHPFLPFNGKWRHAEHLRFRLLAVPQVCLSYGRLRAASPEM